MNFTNRVALVTGGSTGIGEATRKLLAREGARVYVLDIQPFESEKNVFYQECNVSNYESVQQCIKTIYEKEGRIDHCFANAGIYLFADIEETTIEQFEKVLSVNLKGIFYTLKEVLPIMKKQKSGSIVLMGSDQSFVGKAKSSVYGLTKGAIGQLTKSTAIDYAEYGIRVNCICPGTIETPLYHNAVEYYANRFDVPRKEVYDGLKSAQPIKQVGTPEEVAKTVLFLLSDDNSFLTGSLLSIDGGYTCQ
ncbi:MAG: SDR family oxidoreductase [bacterium]|nr:SDR family oxidoreductase [bacterium]